MENGWIKLYRKTKENSIFIHDPTAWRIFEWLLMSVDKKTGQYDTGRFEIEKLLKVKSQTAYKALLRLKKHKMVNIQSNNKYSTITICNWKKYQGYSNTSSNNKVTTKSQQSNNKVTLNKNRELRIKNNTKVLVAKPLKEFGNSNINKIMDTFQNYFKNKPSPEKQQRRYCHHLLKKYTLIEILNVIKFARQVIDEKYAPVICTPKDLYYKWNNLKVYYARRIKEGPKSIEI